MSVQPRHPARPGTGEDRWCSLADLRSHLDRNSVVAVLDKKVVRLHELSANRTIELRAGERSKSFATMQRVCRELENARYAGAGQVVVVGGGTVGDVAGLAAHLTRRGMPLTMVPSTLLAAVDSSIGGKTAINSPGGTKNAFGAFHFPHETLLVQELWQTLERNQVLDGYAEAAKMIICLDSKHATTFMHEMPVVLDLVHLARKLKQRICEADPFEETGSRYVLNFGHTLGHALESLHGFTLSHGCCVALGMRFALLLGRKLGITSGEAEMQAGILLDTWGLPGLRELKAALATIEFEQLDALIRKDKKGSYRFVLLREPGAADLVEVGPAAVAGLIKSLRGDNV